MLRPGIKGCQGDSSARLRFSMSQAYRERINNRKAAIRQKAAEHGLPPPASAADLDPDELAAAEQVLGLDDDEEAIGRRRGGGRLGSHRNKALVGLESMFDSSGQSSYVDSLRMVDPALDIKQAIKQKRSRQGFVQKTMGEVEFQDAGGLLGYVARSSTLMKKKRYVQAVQYLNAAISFGIKDLPVFEKEEGEDILHARQLKAQCLLRLGVYGEALKEAERILKFDKHHTYALLVKAESLYALCQFEHALLAFHDGSKTRAPLYADEFREGVRKCTSAIDKSMVILDGFQEVLVRRPPQFQRFLALHFGDEAYRRRKDLRRILDERAAAMEKLKAKTDPNSATATAIPAAVGNDEEKPQLSMSCLYAMKRLGRRKRTERMRMMMAKVAEEAMRRKKEEEEEERRREQQNQDKKGRKRKRTRLKVKKNKVDKNQARLDVDSAFLDQLKSALVDLTPAAANSTSPNDKVKVSSGVGVTTATLTLSQQRQEEREERAARASRANVTSQVIRTSLIATTNDALGYIGDRKKFWTLQSDEKEEQQRKRREEEIGKKKRRRRPT